MKRTPTKPAKYSQGQTLYNTMFQKDMTINGEPDWNGLTWMYPTSDGRFGEEYFITLEQRAEQLAQEANQRFPKTMQNLAD